MAQGPRPCARLVLVDALNVAHWVGRQPDLRLPLAIACALIESGLDVHLYFDASAPHRLAAHAAIYAQLRAASTRIVQVRSGIRADGELLRHARKWGACVLSRDRFGDYRACFRKLIDDPQRVFGGHVADGAVHLPTLGVSVAVPATLEQAAARFIELPPIVPTAERDIHAGR